MGFSLTPTEKKMEPLELIAKNLDVLAERVKSLEVDKEIIEKETLERTPGASLSDLYKPVIGSPEAKVDGRSTLAKSGPEEAAPETPLSGGLASIIAHIAQRNSEIERGVQ